MLPWWAWVILIVLGLAWLLIWMGMSWRRGIRREFAEYLKGRFKGLNVVEEHVLYLRVEGGRGFDVGMVNLPGLYHAIGQPEVRTPADRREVYEKYVSVIREGVSAGRRKLDPERDAGRIMPRLVNREFFAEEPALAGAPNVPLRQTGLYVVYMLAGDVDVAYLTREHLDDLEMTDAEVGKTALENLRVSAEIDHLVRSAVKKGTTVSVKQLDTYDAARLLLLPELLKEGEVLYAAVPDRDTLVFAGEAERANVETLEEMLLPISEKVLLKRVLRVTSGGVELA